MSSRPWKSLSHPVSVHSMKTRSFAVGGKAGNPFILSFWALQEHDNKYNIVRPAINVIVVLPSFQFSQ